MARDLTIETFDNVPGGSMLDISTYELPDNFAQIIIDGFIKPPNTFVKRGPVKEAEVDGSATFSVASQSPRHLLTLTDKQGIEKIGVITVSEADKHVVLYASTNTFNAHSDQLNLVDDGGTVNASAYKYFDSSATVDGGRVIGFTNTLGESTNAFQYLAFWRGATKAEYFSTGASFTRGSTTVTIASGANANIVPGMFVKAHVDGDNNWTPVLGVVKSVTNDTTIVLESGSLYSKGGSDGVIAFCPFVGFAAEITTGLITTTTTATTVVGSNTKFKTQLINIADPVTGYTSCYDLFRREDMKWIGKVSSTTDDETITLAANATIDMQDEEYVAINRFQYRAVANSVEQLVTTGKINSMGFLSCVYAGRQWYANIPAATTLTDQWNNRAWFSEVGDPLAVDTTLTDGSFMNIDSTSEANSPLVAMKPFRGSLLFWKEKEVFRLTGANINQFSVRSLYNDGALSTGAVVRWEDTVLWAGRTGIYGYDGSSVTNLIRDSISNYWKDMVDNHIYDYSTVRVAVYRNYLFVSASGLKAPYDIYKGLEFTDIKEPTIVINLKTRAVHFFTNLHFYGSVESTRYSPHSFYVADEAGTTRFGTLADIIDKDLAQVTDSMNTQINAFSGPMAFIETKKYSAKQLLQKKRWKLMLLNYLSEHKIYADLIPSLQQGAASQTVEFPPTSSGFDSWDTFGAAYDTWDEAGASFASWEAVSSDPKIRVKRAKFMKPDVYLSLRIYEEDPTQSNFEIHNWGLGYRFYRPGRV